MNKTLKTFWLATLSASILANPFISYTGRDSGIFLYIGSLVLKGKTPYIDAWENKGPLIFYINALGLALTNGSRWGIWLLEFLFIFISSYLSYYIVKKIMGKLPALLGTFLFIGAAGNVLQGGNYSEEYSLLFSFSAILFFIQSVEESKQSARLNEFFIGITLGLNILLRPNNISAQVAIAGAYFILALLSKDWKLLVKRAAQIATGMLAVILPALLYFAARHALTEMINVVIVFNAQYSEGGGVTRVLDGSINAARGIGLPLIIVTFLGYFLALVSLFKRNSLETMQAKFLLVLIIGLPLEAILSALSGKNYDHYFIGWALYVGLLCGYVVYLFLKKYTANAEKFSMPLILILMVITLAANFSAWKNYGAVFAQIGKPDAKFDYRDSVVDYIQKNTSPKDKIFVWGFRPIINFAAQRESPVTYLPYPLSHVDTPLAQHWASEFYSQLQANPPALIINMIEPADRERIPDLDPEVRKQYKIKWKDVVLAYNYKDVLNFIQQHYIRVDTINGNDVYKLSK